MRRASRHVTMRDSELRSVGFTAPLRHSMIRFARTLTIALAALCLPALSQAAEGLQLQLQDNLIDPDSHPAEETPTFGIADQVYGTNEVDTTLVGNAEVRRASGIIKGDFIHYDQLTDELFAKGSVRLYRNNNTYTGPELRLRLDDYQGFFVAPDYYLWGNQGRGFADRINFLSRQRSTMIEPIYTTCPPGDYEWYMTADTMDLDQSTQQGVGHNATVYFQGVPILTSPYLSFPLSNERRSGFLPPTFSATSTSGFELLVPYYWNIAPNRDLTVYNNLMSKRGLQEAGDFRFLEPTYKGDFRIEGLEDQETNTFRYSMLLQGNWAGTGLFQGFSAYMNYQKVSDANYFVDFSRNLAAASTRTLPRDLELTYSSTYWNLTVRALRYQTLELDNSIIAVPYDKVPEFELHAARLDYGGFDFGLTGFATRFETIGAVGGDRFVLNPSVSYPLVGAGWFVTPKVSYNSTVYALTDQAGGIPNSFTRNVPTFSIDSGLVFERNTDIFGTDVEQTLEPRLFYVRRPYRDQSQLPDFDSGIPDFNFSQLFAENSFTGYDRLADEDQLTAAVTTRLLNPENGAELFRAAFGLRYYISGQKVTVPGIGNDVNPLVPLASLTASEPVPGGSTDFLALASGQLTPTIAIDAGVDYSQTVGAVERSDFGVRWTPGNNRELGFDYRTLHGQLYQYDLSGEYPLGGGWYGVGRVNYDFQTKRLVEGLAGFEYHGCCWVVRFAAQQFVTSAITQTTTFFVQLELNGFSQIGTNPLDALRHNVSGYSPIVEPKLDDSPFDHYE